MKIAIRAVNGARTRDPELGKLMLYQLSYYRKCSECKSNTFIKTNNASAPFYTLGLRPTHSMYTAMPAMQSNMS